MAGFFKSLFARRAEDGEACIDLGDEYMDAGQLDKSIACYTKAVRCDDPQIQAVAYNNRGYAYLMKDKYERAVEDCSEAIRLDPGFAVAFINRGIARGNIGETDQAIADFTEAICLDPEDPRGFYDRGAEYCRQGKFDAALEDLLAARRLDAEAPNYFYDAGTEALTDGEDARAIVLFGLAIQLDPDMEPAWCNRGFAHFHSGQIEEALADYTQAVQLEPTDGIAARGRQMACRSLRNVVDADNPLVPGSLFDQRCMFRFVVYYLPKPATEPMSLLRKLLDEQFPQLSWSDGRGSDEQSDCVMAFLDSQPTADPRMPDLETLRYFGHGITEHQAEALARSEMALVLSFEFCVDHVFERMYDACALVRAVAQGTGGVIWDEETRECFSPEEWRQRRLSARPSQREFATHVTAHCYEEGAGYRIITLGMAKFGLPDVVVNDCAESLTQRMADLLGSVCARMAMGQQVEDNGVFSLASGIPAKAAVRPTSADSMEENAKGEVAVRLVREEPHDGDPDNRIARISFDEHAGSSVQEQQQAILAAWRGDESVAPADGDGRRGNPDSLVAGANVLASQGQYDRAIAELTEALQLDPTLIAAYIARGNAYDNMGERDAAICDYTEAIRLDPQCASAYYNRAVAHGFRGDDDAALADYDRAISLCSTRALYYASRSVPLVRLGHCDRAIGDCTRAIEIDPNFAPAFSNRGDADVALGDYETAIADYTEAIRLDPGIDIPYARRGDVYQEQGEYDKAISDYSEALRIDPNEADYYYGRGSAHQEQGDSDRAIEDYTKTIQIQGDHQQAYVGRANAYAEKREFDRAISDIDEAVRISTHVLGADDPRLAYLHLIRGSIYGDMGQHDRAATECTRVIELDPYNSVGYFERAKAYRALGEKDKATNDYRKYEQLQELAKVAEFLDRASEHFHDGDLDKAIDVCTEAIQISSDVPVAFLNRGVAYANQGDWDEAMSDFNEAIRLDPEHATAYYFRGMVHRELGELESASADYAKAKELGFEPDSPSE